MVRGRDVAQTSVCAAEIYLGDPLAPQIPQAKVPVPRRLGEVIPARP